MPARLLHRANRLIGHRLQLRLHDYRIEAYLRSDQILILPGRRRAKGAPVVHDVSYRHVIAELLAKLGALTHLAYREASIARPSTPLPPPDGP